MPKTLDSASQFDEAVGGNRSTIGRVSMTEPGVWKFSVTVRLPMEAESARTVGAEREPALRSVILSAVTAWRAQGTEARRWRGAISE